jgi:hypothetical protein
MRCCYDLTNLQVVHALLSGSELGDKLEHQRVHSDAVACLQIEIRFRTTTNTTRCVSTSMAVIGTIGTTVASAAHWCSSMVAALCQLSPLLQTQELVLAHVTVVVGQQRGGAGKAVRAQALRA